jgi:hypothetical protein
VKFVGLALAPLVLDRNGESRKLAELRQSAKLYAVPDDRLVNRWGEMFRRKFLPPKNNPFHNQKERIWEISQRFLVWQDSDEHHGRGWCERAPVQFATGMSLAVECLALDSNVSLYFAQSWRATRQCSGQKLHRSRAWKRKLLRDYREREIVGANSFFNFDKTVGVLWHS